MNEKIDLITLSRIYQKDCTVGVLNCGEFRCFTLELPYKENKQNVSCILPEVYKCKKINSPSLGDCIEISDVEDRTFVRIHAGNYTSQIQGCVLVGDSLKDINKDGVIDVTNSRNTLKELMDLLPEEFLLSFK